MLTRSPIAPHASKASPSLFHYAPHASRSPHHSPRTPLARAQPSAAGRGPTTLKTTSSSSSSSSPAPGRCRHAWVGVDAATQYSPMEPFDYSAPRRPRQQPASTAEHQQPRASTSDSSSTPASTTMTTTADQTMASVPGASAHNTPSRQPPPEPTLEARGEQPRSYEAATTGTQTAASSLRTATKVSPSKRRGSPSGAGRRESEGDRSCSAAAGSSAGSDTAASASNMAKRPKTKAAPPKVLPRAYEHCDVEDMAVLIAHMLGELIETNDALNLRSRPLTRFHSRCVTNSSRESYISQLPAIRI